MPIQPTIETECPLCESGITLVDFDPEDKSDDGQDIECPECGAVFTDWEVEDDGSLSIDLDSAADKEAEAYGDLIGATDEEDEDDDEEEPEA